MTAPSDPSSRLPAIGQRIAGKYRIEEMIGRGGMGAVFVAEHEILNQKVAIKVLLPERADDPALATRLLNEARAAARIRSEHVARVLDVDEFETGGAFIVLEYLTGMNLESAIEERGRLPADEAAHYVIEALEALAQAHAIGIVHRDLKPSNLFLAERPDGSVVLKVLDFGVSKHLLEGEELQGGLTKTSAVVGSPLFMAPEQVRDARAVDPRADIWSIGVILYKLLGGRMPFVADSLGGAFAAVLTDDPRPLRTIAPDVPEALDAVVLRCLAKSRDARYADVGELAEALAPFAPGSRALVDRIGRTLLVGRASTPRAGSVPRISPVAVSEAPTGPRRVELTPLGSTVPSGPPPPPPPPARGPTPTPAPAPAPTARDDSLARGPTILSADAPVRASRSARVVGIGAAVGAAVAALVVLLRGGARESRVEIEAGSFAYPEDLPRARGSAVPPRSDVPRDDVPRDEEPTAAAARPARRIDAGRGALPRSCAEAREGAVVPDGTYRIDPDGAGPVRPFEVYCHRMGDPQRPPREYLTLARGAASGEPDANATTYVWRGGPCACPDLRRRFTRVRFDPTDLSIDASDGTFATYDRSLDCELHDRSHCGERIDVAYAGAGSCRAAGDTSGRASIDLRGTPFALAPDTRFVPAGFGAAGSATIAPDRKSATLLGGGLCGVLAPTNAPKIALVQDR